jgi:hypothetical protein
MRTTCVALSFVTTIVAGSSAAQERAANPGADAELRRANQQEVAAFMATDPVALARLWSKEFVVTNPLNQLATAPQVLAMVKGGALSFKSYERTIEYIHHYGDIAVVAGAEKVEWTGKMPLAGKLLPLRFTAVWLSTPSGWQEVARHANVAPAP